jgi:excisionase family DNA binding protein
MSASSEGRKILHIAEAARYLGIGRSTLYDWITAGQFPIARCINGRWYVTRAEIDRWLDPELPAEASDGTPDGPSASTALLDASVSRHGLLAGLGER